MTILYNHSMRILDIDIGRGKRIRAYEIELEPAPLILAAARNGWAACGWFDINLAEKKKAAAVQAVGVNSIEEFLEAPVTGFTAKAGKYRIRKGMRMKTALLRLS